MEIRDQQILEKNVTVGLSRVSASIKTDSGVEEPCSQHQYSSPGYSISGI